MTAIVNEATIRSWLRRGELSFAETLESVELSAPSLLPDWNRADIAAHIAGNAVGLTNLLHWARTGIETPMYASPEARLRDIAEWAARPEAELRAYVADTSAQLASAIDQLPADAWHRFVRSALGREIRSREVPWLRVREVWIHAADLGGNLSFDAFPADLVDALLDEITGALGYRPGCPDVLLMPYDREQQWRIAPADRPTAEAVPVRGTASDLLAWASGRSSDSFAGRPTLPAWL